MKTNFLRAAFVGVLMSTTAAVTAHAQTNYGSPAPQPSTAAPAAQASPKPSDAHVSRDVGKDLEAAQAALKTNDYKTALTQVQAAQALSDRTAYDDFTINRFLSAVSARTQDYKTAATAYDTFIASPYFAALTPDEQKAAYHDATIVSQNVGHWPKVVEYGQKLEALKGLDDLTMTMVAIGYYQLKDNANAKKYAQMAIDTAKAEGKTPQANAQIIIGNIEGKTDPDAARKAVEALVLSSNDPDDWGRLIDDALSQKANSIDALYLYRLRDQVGAMKIANDYLILAELATQQKLDKEAAAAYDKGIDAGKLTSSQAGKAYATAKRNAAMDSSVLSAAASAASRSKRGEDALRVGEDYWGYGRYADAAAMAQQALTKGVKDRGEATMLLGASQAVMGQEAAAEATLTKVSGNHVRMRAAHLWSLYAQVKAKGTTASH